MAIYAILNKDTNIVTNVINADDENSIFLNSSEYFAPANRAVLIGMSYDKDTKTYPSIGDLGDLLDLKDEIQSLILGHQLKMAKNSHMTPEQEVVHVNYINELQIISELSSYVEMKSQFDNIGPEPEVPPAPKEITQDVFRGALNLTEKILWDNPETGTEVQKATINTLKMDFPHYGVESIADELELLEQVGFFTAQRVSEVTQSLS